MKMTNKHQNKTMNKIFTIIVVMFCVSIVGALFPYPIFSATTNVTQKEMLQINNFHETELKANCKAETKILDINFSDINAIFPVLSQFEIFDMTTGQSFFVIRTGGQNHFDIEPLDAKNAETIFDIATNLDKNNVDCIWSWNRFPALVKINDLAYLPASIAYFPHGFSLCCNSFNGHLCLHFKNSKTDGTNKIDNAHKQCISYAKKNAKTFLENFAN